VGLDGSANRHINDLAEPIYVDKKVICFINIILWIYFF
jgi:hypothetical protein